MGLQGSIAISYFETYVSVQFTPVNIFQLITTMFRALIFLN